MVKRVHEYNGIDMNSNDEVKFASHLDWMLVAGEIASWEYETVTLDLAQNLKCKRTYCPDFIVTLPDGTDEIYEVKGWHKGRTSSIKVFENAANLYCHIYNFYLVEWKTGGLSIKHYEGRR